MPGVRRASLHGSFDRLPVDTGAKRADENIEAVVAELLAGFGWEAVKPSSNLKTVIGIGFLRW